ncbi:hypothetical protein A2U01_0069167, partial [Trifolium medium]|nr:hypothetical protein [Trifolium medium]
FSIYGFASAVPEDLGSFNYKKNKIY